MRGFFQWAVENERAKGDPTQGIRKIAGPTGDGFAVWTEQEIAAFESRWPLGTRERLMLDLFQFTGLRRGDVALLGRQHVSSGVITITTEKTATRVVIPMLPELARTLAASPCGDLTFVVGMDEQQRQGAEIGAESVDAGVGEVPLLASERTAPWVGEVDRTVGSHDDVVRPVEAAPLKAVGDHRDGAVHLLVGNGRGPLSKSVPAVSNLRAEEPRR
jgi:hypothetical protein